MLAALLTCSLAADPIVGPAWAGSETSLLYFSAELGAGRAYAGAGVLKAPGGLDFTGPVFAAEIGRSYPDATRASGLAGLRFVRGNFVVTAMAGFEVERQLRPLATTDLWWQPTPNLMASAFLKATTDRVTWRLAAGRRPAGAWPWLGPEAAWSDDEPRAGFHATGFALPGGAFARASAGLSWHRQDVAPYAELSVWRRF